MAKKSAISGEYIITVEDSGTVRVCKIYDNVIGSLREIAEAQNFTIDPKWNTQETGRRICKEFGDGNMSYAVLCENTAQCYKWLGKADLAKASADKAKSIYQRIGT